MKRRLPSLRRIVVKVGSGLIAESGRGPDPTRIGRLAADLAAVIARPLEVALVSSGAIAAGTARLGLRVRPRTIPEKQAAAAAGQAALMWHYEQAFLPHGRQVAQVLLTQEDISHRARYLNARNTLLTLLGYGVLPIINENDTVAVEEIKVGDNDNLAALVAYLVEADLLVLLSDTDGLYTGDPNQDPTAERIDTVEAITPEMERLAGARGPLGTGGMVTKLQAAQKAMAAGIPMVIADGRRAGVLDAVLDGEPVGTYFEPRGDRLTARKRWIAFAIAPQGMLEVDAGARRALVEGGKSLLPSGVVKVEGEFSAGDAVGLRDPEGREFARGIVNYDAREVATLRGARTRDIERLLGYRALDEVIHRDDLVIL
ncbi:MAG TPA: glutamate 5-kinase [Methylomirabilota bacterium]|jgi:glutamate 5-kinase|nr:glutamate 5-kinase [Methylomirabilota bacterium]